MHILTLISLGISKVGQHSEFLWAIADVSFDEARASIYLCYNTVYVKVPI